MLANKNEGEADKKAKDMHIHELSYEETPWNNHDQGVADEWTFMGNLQKQVVTWSIFKIYRVKSVN